VNAIIVGILLSGLALGIGSAFRSRRVWAWGVEELAQSIINAALLGVLLAWVASVDTMTYSFFDLQPGCQIQSAMQPNSTSLANAPLQYSVCSLASIQNSTIHLIQDTSLLSYKLGYLSGLTVSADVVQMRPFSQFGDLSSSYSQWAGHFALLLSSASMLWQFLSFAASSILPVFLPAGLLLRMFFATRKLGGAIMAASIGFYVVFPLAYSSLLNAEAALSSIRNARGEIAVTMESLAIVPIADLGKSGEVYALLSNLSNGELPQQSSAPYAALAQSRAALELALLFMPIVALGLTAVAIRELYLILGSELNINLFEIL